MFKRKLFAVTLILVLVSSLAVWVGTSKATPASGLSGRGTGLVENWAQPQLVICGWPQEQSQQVQ